MRVRSMSRSDSPAPVGEQVASRLLISLCCSCIRPTAARHSKLASGRCLQGKEQAGDLGPQTKQLLMLTR